MFGQVGFFNKFAARVSGNEPQIATAISDGAFSD